MPILPLEIFQRYVRGLFDDFPVNDINASSWCNSPAWPINSSAVALHHFSISMSLELDSLISAVIPFFIYNETCILIEYMGDVSLSTGTYVLRDHFKLGDLYVNFSHDTLITIRNFC